MTTHIIDGKAIAAALRADIATHTAQLRAAHGITPGLAVVLVGDDPASQVYVRNKVKAASEAGIHSIEHRLPADTSQAVLMETVAALNADPSVHGILVQLPLPKGLDEKQVVEAILPEKDVDGFHPVNRGRWLTGEPEALIPCTPRGSMLLLRSVCPDLSGKRALVIGRSAIVGKPMAALLLNADCTVTVAHSRTQNLPALVAEADIVVAAIGKPLFVQGAWLKEGAIVLDVGINRIQEGGKDMLVGDVDFASSLTRASAITPVPGGVGPMTIACLLENTLIACRRQLGVG
jgi:methylenetetrahydrofolate dehydrogenase (NADP+)/methenyltetrahydrofolate cyclohydrolase